MVVIILPTRFVSFNFFHCYCLNIFVRVYSEGKGASIFLNLFRMFFEFFRHEGFLLRYFWLCYPLIIINSNGNNHAVHLA